MICTKDGEPDSDLPKIRYERIIKADRVKVFEIATNYESFEKTLPQYFPSIRIRSNRDNVTIIEEHVCVLGKEMVMMTKHVTTHPKLHEVFVIGGDAKGSHITEQYTTIPQGTRVSIEADIKLKGIMRIGGFFYKSKIQKGFEMITDEFVRLAEG